MTTLFETLEDRAFFSVSLSTDTTLVAPAPQPTVTASASTPSGTGRVQTTEFTIKKTTDAATAG